MRNLPSTLLFPQARAGTWGNDWQQGLVLSDVARCTSVSSSVIRVIIAPAWDHEGGMEKGANHLEQFPAHR